MQTLSLILVALVALEHSYILWIEMFAWTSKGREVFRGVLPDELFEQTKGLAANQGLYNGSPRASSGGSASQTRSGRYAYRSSSSAASSSRRPSEPCAPRRVSSSSKDSPQPLPSSASC